MRRFFEIMGSSFRLALLELRNNKLRTTLSLLGVTFGIFCIIGVLATVNSLETNVQNDIKKLGDNTIYIDKWDYGGGEGQYPWWKYVNRPEPTFHEMELLKQDTAIVGKITYVLDNQANVETETSVLERIDIFGPGVGFEALQPFEMQYGRYFSTSELEKGSPIAVIGFSNAEALFGRPEKAIGQKIKVRGKEASIVGVIKKQGKGVLGGGWEFDEAVILPHPYFKQVFREKWSNPKIMIQGKEGIALDVFKDELTGKMRNIRRLGPAEEDDFTLNAISDFSKAVSGFFGSVTLGGWFIGLLSLIVGAFSIANIMFVTVRERTPIIGLKKAIGAKKSTILAEFLLESAFICLVGGAIGVILVFGLTFLLTSLFNFPVFISMKILGVAVGICIAIGIGAGIIPASIAAKLDPVVAIRSK